MKISVGVSNRHCHLTKEVYENLFGKSELTFKRALNQPGQFASEQKVDLVGPKNTIKGVSILGPCRKALGKSGLLRRPKGDTPP